MQCVNIENWSYCRYQSGDFMAMISFGADPESLSEGRLEYYVTVLEKEEQEVFQQQFATLGEACLYLNTNYADWTFENQTVAKTGCSTCAAH
jgi:hypothetical protein